MEKNPSGTYVFRLLAGGYLVYLAYSFVTGYLEGTSDNFWLTVIAAGSFGIIGAVFVILSLKNLYKMGNGEIESEDEAAEDSEAK